MAYEATKADWIRNAVGVEKRPADPTWQRSRTGLDTRGYVGPSAAYRALPSLGGCSACGMGQDPWAVALASGMSSAMTSFQQTMPTDTTDTGEPGSLTTKEWVAPALLGLGAMLLFWGTLRSRG